MGWVFYAESLPRKNCCESSGAVPAHAPNSGVVSVLPASRGTTAVPGPSPFSEFACLRVIVHALRPFSRQRRLKPVCPPTTDDLTLCVYFQLVGVEPSGEPTEEGVADGSRSQVPTQVPVPGPWGVGRESSGAVSSKCDPSPTPWKGGGVPPLKRGIVPGLRSFVGKRCGRIPEMGARWPASVQTRPRPLSFTRTRRACACDSLRVPSLRWHCNFNPATLIQQRTTAAL